MRYGARLLGVVGVLLVWASPRSPAEPSPVRFVDQAAAAGVTVRNVSGSAQEYIVEAMMGGSAFFDYDGDGDPDLYVTNGSSYEGFPAGQHPTNRLYRNDGVTFSDVTLEAGVGDTSWSMGCAAADYDNDGDVDLYVANYGDNILHRNEGNGRFRDVTAAAGVGDERWGVAGAFGDYDRDGDVDLFVTNYVDFSPDYESTIPCMWKNIYVYCGPRGLLPAGDVLYRNEGDGTFTDVTVEAGLDKPHFGMSTGFGDFDNDGWPDLWVANDSTPNVLYHNLGNGRFEEIALMAGTAYSGEGVMQGCMGSTIGDFDNDGLLDIFVTTFADEYNILYRNEGDNFFSDVSFVSRVATKGTREISWGTGFFDFDNDGDRDLFLAAGHTYPQADTPQAESSYEMANYLFENLGDGRFEEVSARSGPGLAVRKVSRGASFSDYDSDGDVDVFVFNLNSTPTLLRNDGGNRNNFLLIRTVGTRSNRDGIGTRIAINAAGSRQYAEVQAGTSYGSHNDLRVHFGLGQVSRVDTIALHWPSGVVQTLTGIEANQVLTVTEPEP